MNICIIGAAGRMGRNIAQIIYADKDLEVTGAVDRVGGEFTGQPIYEVAGCGKGGALVTESIADAAKNADVVIDFTGAPITSANIPAYAAAGKPVIIGSTGFSPEQKAAIGVLATKVPVMTAPNMSLGVNVAFKLIELAAASLKGYDIEISETHHRMKKDSPSGTALGMAEAAARGAGVNLDEKAVYARHGLIGERKDGEIGIQALRGGDVIGDHTVFFFGNGERIEITHRAHTRATFAGGAVAAAKWIVGKPAGLYDMNDVLGL